MAISSTCTCASLSALPQKHDQRSRNKRIKQHVLNGNSGRAIQTYIAMQELGFSGDNFTFPILLKAVKTVSRLRVGLGLHSQAIKTGFFYHVYVQTALIKMYANVGQIDDARNVFDKMRVRDSVAWNSMLDSYASRGQMNSALELFDSMPNKDLSSYNIMVSGFAAADMFKFAREMFDQMPERDTVSWNAMISACADSGDMDKARALFEEAPLKNVVTWNTMITACVNNELYSEAVDLFDRMKVGTVEPDYVTVTGALSACAHLRSLEEGTEIDIYARVHGHILKPHVATALIDMYAKCGSIENSLLVFYKFYDKDIFCWNAMIAGLALHGHGISALKLFDNMRETGLKPDDITFIALLSACSHAGLVELGHRLFDSMETEFEIKPKMEHYGCMVDLLGRAKLVERAFRFVEAMPFEPGEAVLGALLSACVTHQELQIGEEVIMRIVRNKTETSGLSDGEYMMFSNLYASCGRFEEAEKWRSLMNDSGVVKEAGCSSVEVDGRLFKFLAGETGLHFQQE